MVFYSLPRGWKPHKTQALASFFSPGLRYPQWNMEYRVPCMQYMLRRTETEGPLVCCARSDVSSRHPARSHRLLFFSLPPATRRPNQPGGRSNHEAHTAFLAGCAAAASKTHANLSRTLRKSGRKRGVGGRAALLRLNMCQRYQSHEFGRVCQCHRHHEAISASSGFLPSLFLQSRDLLRGNGSLGKDSRQVPSLATFPQLHRQIVWWSC